MARTVETVRGTSTATPIQAGFGSDAVAAVQALPPWAEQVEKDKVLPLPGWLVKVYFIFPVILYVPDAIFNYYVYSHGITTADTNIAVQVAFVGLWAFLSVGVVGMAYLLSVLAPWHWGQGHHVQAFFCGLGVLVATAITTWNSLAYRSQEQQAFGVFQTDQWAYSIWPQLRAEHISLTMILVAVAPPFWGLFWALVQPTQSGRSLRQLQESHAERLLRLQQESELKRVKAETNAKIREAQLRGMAHTAAAARAQAKALLSQGRAAQEPSPEESTAQDDGTSSREAASATDETLADVAETGHSGEPASILHMPTLNPAGGREMANGRGSAVFMNHAAAATPAVHAAPATGPHLPTAQPQLLSDADVRGHEGLPPSDTITFVPRRPPVIGGLPSGSLSAELSDAEAMTGTTGPRPTVRRPYELGSIAQRMNGGPSLEPVERAMAEVAREASETGGRKSLSQKDLVTRVAEKLNVDESTARSAIKRVQESRRAARQ
jgi:hypothetical protein